MGTNYYWRHNICSCCNRYDEMHICKSKVSFQGHFGQEWDADERMFVHPWLITSWKDWKAKLRSGGEVWDEYQDRHETEQFIASVETTDLAARRRQYDYCVEHYRPGDIGYRPPGVQIDGEWLDADGFSFYGGDFS